MEALTNSMHSVHKASKNLVELLTAAEKNRNLIFSLPPTFLLFFL